ncbi:MAG TPA: SPOR domain-containing protein [Kofleriaceae bacterium]|jgi:cell division septation protein DedD
MPTREPELYKDKVEVSLDGRQIFYLFFGGAVIVGMVFVLGVFVGRRVEARGHLDRAETAAATDPLAALDRLEGGQGLSFHDTLAQPAAAAPAAASADPLVAPVAAPPPIAAPEPAAAPAAKHDDPPPPAKKAKYTLQISSFQARSDAEALVATMKKDGFAPTITEAEVDGKGTFYRVRVGSYRTLDAANDAKDDLAKSAKKSATVMKL